MNEPVPSVTLPPGFTSPPPVTPQVPIREEKRGVNLLLILTIFFGVGALVFAILSIVAFGQANTAKTTLEAQKQKAAADAREAQKKDDEALKALEAQSPYRSYVSPAIFGSFEIKFPKNWNVYAVENESATNQIDMLIHPDAVRVTTNSKIPNHIQIIKSGNL